MSTFRPLGGMTKERSGLRSGQAEPARGAITLDDKIEHLLPHIRQARAPLPDQRLEPLSACKIGIVRILERERGREQLVDESDRPAAPDFGVDALDVGPVADESGHG